MVYEWREGSRYSVPAQVVGERLERIKLANEGRLTPEAVVEDAAADDSPIRDLFERDDGVAAHKFRVEQARHLIRSVRVVVQTDAGPRVCQGFVSVSTADDGRYYETTAVAMTDAQLRESVLAEALAGLEAWRERYAHLDELRGVFEAVDRVVRRAPKPGPRRPRAGAIARVEVTR